MPGVYRVRLTVDGNPYTQTITVRPDPRSHVSPAARAAQHSLLMRLYSGLQATWTDFRPVAELHAAVAKIAPDDTISEGKAAKQLVTTLDSIAGDSLKDAREVWDARPAAWSFVDLNSEFGLELDWQDNADHAPTQAALAAARQSCAELEKVVGRWQETVQRDVPAFNQLLARRGMTALAIPPAGGKLCAS